MMAIMASFPLKPSIIVRSGRGIMHLYWLLDNGSHRL